MPGMAMPMGNGDAMTMTVRDIEGRRLTIPDGRPGIAVFVEPRGCDPCAGAVRDARDAASRHGASLIVVGIDAGTSRGAMRRFARAMDAPWAHYVIDDRNGHLASMMDAPGLGGIVVFDRRGQVVARPEPTATALAGALRRAGGT